MPVSRYTRTANVVERNRRTSTAVAAVGRTIQQSVTRNIGGRNQVERSIRSSSVAAAMVRTREESVTRNIGGRNQVERSIRSSSVAAAMVRTREESVTRYTGRANQVERSRTTSRGTTALIMASQQQSITRNNGVLDETLSDTTNSFMMSIHADNLQSVDIHSSPTALQVALTPCTSPGPCTISLGMQEQQSEELEWGSGGSTDMTDLVMAGMQSVTRNAACVEEVERGTRENPVATTTDSTRQQSPTRNTGGTDKVERGRSSSPVVSTSDRTIQQLQENISNLQAEIKRKEDERKYYQDEHNKVCESWNATKEELRIKEAELDMKNKMLEETKLERSTEVKFKELLKCKAWRKEQERLCYKQELSMKEDELQIKDEMLEKAKLAHSTEVKLKEYLQREVRRKEQELRCYEAERDTTKKELRIKEAELRTQAKVLEEIKLAHSREVKLKEHLEREVQKKEQGQQYYQVEHDKLRKLWNTTKEELRIKEAELDMKDKKLEEIKLAAHSTEVKLKEHLEREAQTKEQGQQYYQVEHDKLRKLWNTTKEELRIKEAELDMKNKKLEEIKLAAHSTEVKLKEHLEREAQTKEQGQQYYQVEHDKLRKLWNTTKEELRIKEAELDMKDKKLEEIKLAHWTEVKLKGLLECEVQKKEQERQYYQVEHGRVREAWNTTKEELRIKEAELDMKDKMLEKIKLAHLTEVKLKEHLEREVQKKEQGQQYYQVEHDKLRKSWNTAKEELRIKEAELDMKDKTLEEIKLAHSTEVKLKEHLEREVQKKEQERQYYQFEHDKVCESWNTTKEELRMKEAELGMKDKMLQEIKLAHLTEVKMKDHLQHKIEKKEEDRQYYQTERDKFYEYWKTMQEQLKIKEAQLQMKDKMLEQKKIEHSTQLEMKDHLQHEIEKKEEDRQYYQTERDKFYEYWKTTQGQLKAKEAELQMKDKMLEETKSGHSTEVKMKDHLQHEIEKKEEDRQYYQTERDKFYEYWKTTQGQLKAKEAELQMKDKMLEETKSGHSTEVKSYEERLKNVMLEYDNYKNSHPKKHTRAAEIMEVDDDQFFSQVNILQREKCELTSRMNQIKAEHEEFVALLLLEHKKNLGAMKQQYEETVQVLKNKYDEALDTLVGMGETKKKEAQKTEETNNGRSENLAEYHDQAYTDIQNQYGDINGNNWSTIAILKDGNKELQRRERILKIKFDALSRENEFLKGINSYYNEVPIQKDAKSVNHFGVNYLTENKINELNEEVKDLHQKNDLLAEKLKITEIERDSFRSNFESVSQYLEGRMNIKATHAEEKGQTTQENLGMAPALWDPSLQCPSASHQPLELNKELTGMSGETGQLEITARQSGPPTQMSQGIFGTAPSTSDAKGDSMP